MAVSEYTRDQVLGYIATLADRVSYELDSVPDFKLVTPVVDTVNNVVTWNLTIPDTENGIFTNFELKDASNNVVASRNPAFEKNSGTQLIPFKINVAIE